MNVDLGNWSVMQIYINFPNNTTVGREKVIFLLERRECEKNNEEMIEPHRLFFGIGGNMRSLSLCVYACFG